MPRVLAAARHDADSANEEPGIDDAVVPAGGQVRTVPVSTRQMALSELRVQPAKTEQVRSVEASLRLDAIASAGFRMSRAKAADLIKAGDVRQDAFFEHVLTL